MRGHLLLANFGSIVTLVVIFGGGVRAEDFKPTDMCPVIAAHDGIFGSASQIAQLAKLDTEGPVRLSALALEVPRGSSAAAEIAKVGFAPDQSNLALVRYMNPQIPDISVIPENETIFLPKIETFDGATWNTYRAPKPIDGFAIEHKYFPRLTQMAAEERVKAAEQLSGVIDNLKDKPAGQSSLSVYEKVYAELKSKQPGIEDESFSQSIGTLDAYLFATSLNVGIANALMARGNEPDDPNNDTFGWVNMVVATQAQSAGGKAVKVTLRTLERDGREVSGLKMRYMSSGAYRIQCDRKFAATFARDSLDASQVLKRAAWYFWAENPNDNRRTKPVFVDLTTVSDPEYSSNYTLDWE